MSMSAKILIQKIFVPKSSLSTFPVIDYICKYSNLLTDTASKFKGYKNSQSYWDLTNPNKIITITNWNNSNDWNNWFNSTERKDVNTTFNDVDININVSHLMPKLIFEDVALL